MEYAPVQNSPGLEIADIQTGRFGHATELGCISGYLARCAMCHNSSLESAGGRPSYPPTTGSIATEGCSPSDTCDMSGTMCGRTVDIVRGLSGVSTSDAVALRAYPTVGVKGDVACCVAWSGVAART